MTEEEKRGAAAALAASEESPAENGDGHSDGLAGGAAADRYAGGERGAKGKWTRDGNAGDPGGHSAAD